MNFYYCLSADLLLKGIFFSTVEPRFRQCNLWRCVIIFFLPCVPLTKPLNNQTNKWRIYWYLDFCTKFFFSQKILHKLLLPYTCTVKHSSSELPYDEFMLNNDVCFWIIHLSLKRSYLVALVLQISFKQIKINCVSYFAISMFFNIML